MHRQHRRFINGLSLVGIVCLAASCTSSGSSAVSSKTKAASSPSGTTYIGLVAPFTGASAVIGSIQSAGAYPAAAEINAAGGVLGHKVGIKIVNSQGDPADALPAVQQFIATTGNILGVIGPGTNSATTLVPVMTRSKIVMMSQAGESLYNNNTDPYFWRPVPPDSANGVAMSLYAKSQGWTRAATVFGSDSGSQGDLPGVLAGAKALGINVVTQVNVPLDQPSYAAQVARVLAAKPQVIFTETDPVTAGTFFGELVQQSGGKLVHVVSTANGVTLPYVTTFAHAVGSTLFTKMFTAASNEPSSSNPAGTDFNKWLAQSGANVPKPSQWVGNPHAQAVYSFAIIEALAADAAGSTQGSAYHNEIKSIVNPGSGKTTVYTYAQGLKLIKEHKAIRYVPPDGPLDFNKYNNAGNGEVIQTFNPTTNKFVNLQTLSASKINAVKVTGVI